MDEGTAQLDGVDNVSLTRFLHQNATQLGWQTENTKTPIVSVSDERNRVADPSPISVPSPMHTIIIIRWRDCGRWTRLDKKTELNWSIDEKRQENVWSTQLSSDFLEAVSWSGERPVSFSTQPVSLYVIQNMWCMCGRRKVNTTYFELQKGKGWKGKRVNLCSLFPHRPQYIQYKKIRAVRSGEQG